MKRHTQKMNHSFEIRQRKSRRTIKRAIVLSVFSLLLVISLSLGCFSIWSKAQDKDEVQFYKYYTNIEVKYGDTMWDIAARYCDDHYADYHSYIDEVMRINRMLEPELKAGSSLIVPYYSVELKN